MTVHDAAGWTLWHLERDRFKNRETQGLREDMAALKVHIMKLQDLAPKDKAGWPTGNAIETIDDLKRDLARYQTWFDNAWH